MASDVDATFEKAIVNLQNSASDVATEQRAGVNRWFKLGADGDLLDGLDNDKIIETFDRNGTSKMYSDSISNENSYKEAQAAKVQGDVLSAFERDVRMRYRTRVRMMAHSVARQISHGLGGGPIQGSIMQYVKLLLDKGPTENGND